MIDECVEILIENSMFYRSDPQDSSMHWASPDILIDIVYDLIQVAANVLGVAGPTIAVGLWLKEKGKSKKDKTANLDFEKHKTHSVIKKIDINEFFKEDLLLLDAFQDVLQHHGWPERESQDDAQKIYSVILSNLKDQSSRNE